MIYNPYNFDLTKIDWGKPKLFGPKERWGNDGIIYYAFYVFNKPIYRSLGVHSTTFID